MRKHIAVALFCLPAILAGCQGTPSSGPSYPSFIEISLAQPYRVEAGTSFNISVGAVTEEVTYQWSLPSLLKITDGDGTRSITVKCMEEGEIPAGTIGVCAVNGSGKSILRRFWYDIVITPRVIAIASSIPGSQTLYPGETLTLTAPDIEGVETYSWNTPAGFTAVSGQNTSSATYRAGDDFRTIPRGAFKLSMKDEDGTVSEYSFGKMIHIIDISKAKRYGKKAWTRTNLNYAGAAGDLGKVMADDPTGEKYGRYYSWAEAMTGKAGAEEPYEDGDNVTDDEGNTFEVGYSLGKDFGIQIQGVCPEGWHIPNAYDFYDLPDGIAEDYHVRRNTINDCASTKSGIFMPANRETKPMTAMNMVTDGFASSYVRGGKPAAEGGLWVRNEGTITEDGRYFYTTGTGVFPAGNDYPLYLDRDESIGVSLHPFGRIEADGTSNPNFGKYSFHWTATVDKGKHYRFTVGFNTANLSTYAETGVYESIRCVANY